ncbi:ThiF family adenylyltransferase [Rossellomorea arthrocnemi]|uniref:ThiF family adenylyltransferase n=1 Tax=Rossellomorea arthrocnemi TaxID=2769542 RepID=UPI00191B18CE|nr:ThiF family adenylyltransferase [Rossellomorea arthrocnemi]
MINLLESEHTHSNKKKLFPIIVQCGVGGTGSNLSQQLAQMLTMFKQNAYYLLADPDHIEQKNINNQLFTASTVGKKKAEVLAKRYAAAYNLNIHSFTEGFVEDTNTLLSLYNTNYIDIPGDNYDTMILPILIGCVDNNYSRRVFHEFFEKSPTILYIDAGNESTTIPADFLQRPKDKWTYSEVEAYNESGWTGQVVAGLKIKGKTILEPVATRFPDIMEEDPDEIKPSELSCQELVASEPQRLGVNKMAAMGISLYLSELFECGTLSNSMTVFHAKRGYMQSEKIKFKEDEMDV